MRFVVVCQLMRCPKPLAIFVACALSLASAGAGAQTQKKLAVLQFDVSKGLSVERETFCTRFQNAAQKLVPDLFVMTESNILSIVQAQGKTLDQCEGECAVETGRLLGADFIVTGRISKLGKGLTLSMQLYDSAKGNLLDGEDVDGLDEAELMRKTVAAAPALLRPLLLAKGDGEQSTQQPGERERPARAVAVDETFPKSRGPAPVNPVSAPDPRRADIADLVRQARAVAVAQESHVDKLNSVVAFHVVGGFLDSTQPNAASIDFSFKYTDATKAPGQNDVVEGSVSVHVRRGGMEARTTNALSRDERLAEPKCSSKAAWAAAVASGVPINAVSTFHLYDNTAFSPKSPTVWSIRVDGHDEYRREIDATNCELVKSWDESGSTK